MPGWCVKLQWEGRRRTFRLASEVRADAALEAMEIHGELRRGGWSAVEGGRRVNRAGRFGGMSGPRVGVRKYVSDLHRVFQRELFAEIEFQGEVEQVALGTEDANQGRLRAAEIQAEVMKEGWERVRWGRSREVTVAVFWQANPMICTYTTLLSLPVTGNAPNLAESLPMPVRGWRVLVIEPDGPVRRAIVHWLGQSPIAMKVSGLPSPEVASADGPWDVVLANRSFSVAALKPLEERLGPEGGVRLLSHGLFADSDAIFASVSGVSRGYFLQRLPPSRLLDPLLVSVPDGPMRTRADEERSVRRYFQNTFEPLEAVGDSAGPELSVRETQVLELLVRGLADKQIANELGISVWTVHSHLKRIFAKFGVRTRTEAVVRHLQK